LQTDGQNVCKYFLKLLQIQNVINNLKKRLLRYLHFAV